MKICDLPFLLEVWEVSEATGGSSKNHKGLQFGQINPDGTVSPLYPDLPDGSIYLYTACGGYSCTNAFKTPDGTIKYYSEPTALAKMNFSIK